MEEKAKLGPSAKQTQLYEQVLAKLNGVKRYNNYAMALCPFHDDHNPSLRVTKRRFRCFSSKCGKRGKLSKLARKLGIEVPEEPEDPDIKQKAIEYIARRLRLSHEQARDFMDEWDIKAGRYGAFEGIYIDLLNGDKKFRALEEKEFRHIGNSEEPAFFDLINLLEEHTVIITEGTFDALTFLRFDLPVISLEGQKYRIETALELLKDRGIGRVVLAFDNDEAGESYRERAIQVSLEKGFMVLLFDIPPQYKDVNELYMSDPNGFMHSLEALEENNLFEWYIKRNAHLLENAEGQRLIYAKLVAIYDRALDKKTNHELLMKTLSKHGLSYDEWFSELERIEIIRANEKKRSEFISLLEQVKDRVRAGADIYEVTHTLMASIRDYEPIDVRTIDEDEELLEEGFPESECLKFDLLPEIELYPSDVLLISAKTKAGKTTLALNLFHEVLERGLRALYVTYELTKVQIFEFLVSLHLQKERKLITRDDKKKVTEQFAGIAMIRHNVSLDDIVALVNTFRPRAFFIDYDQQVPTKGRFESEERRVAHIVRTLKALAVDTNSVCVLLSQENEKEETRYSKEKAFYASVHLHLDKEEDKDEIKYEIRLNRYGRAGAEGSWKVDFSTRKMNLLDNVKVTEKQRVDGGGTWNIRMG